MKVITTRDDVDTLQNKYIVNPNIKTSRVGDPALWVPECYDVQPGVREGAKVIGVNVIRGRVYQAYGNSLSEFQLMNFYKKLISGIEERGWDWVLFSNGMAADQKFGKQLLSAMRCTDPKKLWNPPKNTAEFLEKITSFRCVFGARLHACSASYALDIPVVGLIWSEKLQIFSEVIGKKESFFTEDNLHIEQILDAIQNAMDTGYDASIRAHLRELTNDYLKQFLQMLGE